MTSKSWKCTSVTPVWETRRKKLPVRTRLQYIAYPSLRPDRERFITYWYPHGEERGPQRRSPVHCWLMRYPVLHESFLKKENFTPTFYCHATTPLSTRLSTGHSQIKKQMFRKEEWQKKRKRKKEMWRGHMYTGVFFSRCLLDFLACVNIFLFEVGGAQEYKACKWCFTESGYHCRLVTCSLSS